MDLDHSTEEEADTGGGDTDLDATDVESEDEQSSVPPSFPVGDGCPPVCMFKVFGLVQYFYDLPHKH